MSVTHTHRHGLARTGELLVIGGVAAEVAAAHLSPQILALVPSLAPDCGLLSLLGGITLLVGLVLEWLAREPSANPGRSGTEPSHATNLAPESLVKNNLFSLSCPAATTPSGTDRTA